MIEDPKEIFAMSVISIYIYSILNENFKTLNTKIHKHNLLAARAMTSLPVM